MKTQIILNGKTFKVTEHINIKNPDGTPSDITLPLLDLPLRGFTARLIRKLYKPYSKEYNAYALARKYNVKHNIIYGIISGKFYKE